jgi:DNA-binding beta-propeller fold protein YncE
MNPMASVFGGRRHRRRSAFLVAVALVAAVITPMAIRSARAQVASPIPAVPIAELDLPDLPSTADLASFLSLFPAAPDPKQLDLTKNETLKGVLASLPVDVFNPTFKLTDDPATWFDTGFTITGGRSLAPVLKLPGIPIKATFVVGPDTGAAMAHTVTSLIRPVGAPPIDQASTFIGTREYEFTEPGLYAFTCKIHPYMLGAAVVDDPITPGIDFGQQSIVKMYNGATVVPTYSDLIFRLVKTFFTATVPANWQVFDPKAEVTWDPAYPPAPILTTKKDGTDALLPTLDGFFQEYFEEPKVLPAGNNLPTTPGVGEVWIDTQFEKTAGKSKPGTTTAIDVERWAITKKAALPGINLNNPHNMWTDRAHEVIYQTEWFDNKLSVFDRETLDLIRQTTVGPSPSHVMTRTDTDQLVIALNGGNAVVELAPGGTRIERSLLAQRPGEAIAHPHAQWISSDGKRMVTPNPNTGDATLFDVPTGTIIQKPRMADTPIASSMAPDDSKYYVANLLGNSISCVSMDIAVPSCASGSNKVIRKTIRLDSNWDLVGKPSGMVGILPIQMPVSPDGAYMLVADTTSATIAVIDTKKDVVTKFLPCDPGCHGINFGAKAGGGYYGYVSNKFSNRMMIVDGDPNGDGNPSDAAIAGTMVLSDTPSTMLTDDVVVGLHGMGGQGVLGIPLVYNGWVQTLPAEWASKLTCRQRDPLGTTAC